MEKGHKVHAVEGKVEQASCWRQETNGRCETALAQNVRRLRPNQEVMSCVFVN